MRKLNNLYEKDSKIRMHWGNAPKELSGKNYDIPYHFTDILYNEGY